MKLILIAIILALVLLVWYINGHVSTSNDEQQTVTTSSHDCSSCSTSGQCIADCALQQATTKPQYFDDEELDAFRGRPSDSYQEAEIEQFADVLYTMKKEEISQWLASLSLRDISLPNDLKPEVEMMMADTK